MKYTEYEIGVEIGRLLNLAEAGLSHKPESFQQAFNLCEEAYSLIPEPKMEYIASLAVLGRIMLNHYRLRNFDTAIEILNQLETVQEFAQNEFVVLCKGKLLVEKELIAEAHIVLKGLLTRVGEEIFLDDDPKYLYVAKFGKLPTRRYYPHRKKKEDVVWRSPAPTSTDNLKKSKP
jgi:tetratricopeptide (TPR) repeat protein